jgi:response regulator RpfG family c-di-GMP phosphodiesterase
MVSARDTLIRRERRVMVVDADPEIIQILKANLTHANLDVISACNGTEALTKATREQPEVIILDAILPDLDSTEVCRRLKESRQTAHVPVIAIGTQTESESKIACEVEYYVAKPFVPSEVVSLVEACFKRMERHRNTNPLTGLPNQIEVNKELTVLIEQKKTFAAIYIDMNGFKAFNKAYGFGQGDRAIQLLARILLEAVQLFGNPSDLVGHLGGDDFVVISTPYKARVLGQKITADFDERIKALCDPRDLEMGYIEYESLAGYKEKCPTVTLSVVVVTNERRKFAHHLQVSETAAEIREYLRRFSGSNYYFDHGDNGIQTRHILPTEIVPPTQSEEIKILWAVLEKIALLTTETETAAMVIRDCLGSLGKTQGGAPATMWQDNLKAIEENAEQLLRVGEEFRDLTNGEWDAIETTVEEVDLKKTFDSIIQRLQNLTRGQGIEVILDSGGICHLMANGRCLTKGLFYLLRSVVKSGTHGDRVRVRLSEPNDDFITVEITNDNRLSSMAELARLPHDKQNSPIHNEPINDLRLAKALLHCLGVELEVTGEKEQNGGVMVRIPKSWQSSMEEINNLQRDAEKRRQEAWDNLKNIRHLLSSTMTEIPSAIQESLENLASGVQDFVVLCNRSLFLADNLSSHLERQQEQLLQQEVEQLATARSVLTVSRETARLSRWGYLFDAGSAQRTARNALSIADELGLSRNERQALHCAALLKDLGLVLVPDETLKSMVPPTLEKASSLREWLDTVWKSLSELKFMAPALSIISHRYEKCDSTGYPLRARDANISLGARILAVADAFDTMTSGRFPQATLEPEQAIQRFIADAGQHFDPGIVSAFLRVWKRKAFQIDYDGSRWESYKL